MGIFHWLTGTEAPDPTIPRQSAQSLRTALLGLNRDDLAWAIAPDPGDDEILVAGWKYQDPHWRALLFEAELSSSIHIKVFLDEARSTVRSVDEQVEVGLINTADGGVEIGVEGFGDKQPRWAHILISGESRTANSVSCRTPRSTPMTSNTRCRKRPKNAAGDGKVSPSAG